MLNKIIQFIMVGFVYVLNTLACLCSYKFVLTKEQILGLHHIGLFLLGKNET